MELMLCDLWRRDARSYANRNHGCVQRGTNTEGHEPSTLDFDLNLGNSLTSISTSGTPRDLGSVLMFTCFASYDVSISSDTFQGRDNNLAADM